MTGRLVALFLAAACCSQAFAESLHDIKPLDTLGDIKRKYPNANIQRVNAAWVREGEAFFSLSGEGFPGALYLDFEDSRPAERRYAEQAEAAGAAASSASAAENQAALAAYFRHEAAQTDDEALAVSWVRWVPEQPIPLMRYKSRYGEPSKCDYQASNMRPFCFWESKALQVNLTDDQSKVVSVEAYFTKAEQRAAWDARFKYHPPSLDEPQTSSKAPGKAASKPAKGIGAARL